MADNEGTFTSKKCHQVHVLIADAGLVNLADAVEMANLFDQLGRDLAQCEMAVTLLASSFDAEQKARADASLKQARETVASAYAAIVAQIDLLIAKTTGLRRQLDHVAASIG